MSTSKRLFKYDNYSDIRERDRIYSNDMYRKYDSMHETGNLRDPYRWQSGARSQFAGSYAASYLMEVDDLTTSKQRPNGSDIVRPRVTGGLGAATLDHFVSGPNHRAEEPLEGNKQNAKLSYSLAGPFNRKVYPFESSSVHQDPRIDTSVPYSAPRILSPEASPRGSDSLSSDGGTCRRLKRRLMNFNPATSTPDHPGLINGLSGSSKSLSQFQQKNRKRHLEKENEDYLGRDKGNSLPLRSTYPSGPIDEKPGIRHSGVTRKVVEGPSGQEYRGFSRGPNHGTRGATINNDTNHVTAPAKSESHGNLFRGRRVDSQNSLNTAQSQASLGKRPTRKDNISTRSWRKGQELILKELGPNKVPNGPQGASKASTKDMELEEEEEEGGVGRLYNTNINNANDDGLNDKYEKAVATTDVAHPKKRKPVPFKSNVNTSTQSADDPAPSKPKERHYNVAEIRAYLRKQQEMRKKKRQEEEAANEAKLERFRRQISDLREQQLAAIKVNRTSVSPTPNERQATKPVHQNFNKTYTIDHEDERMDHEDLDLHNECEHDQRQDLPMTLQDLELPYHDIAQPSLYQPPKEKYHEVWPLRSNGEPHDIALTNNVSMSPRGGVPSPDPPVAVASRLTALEESASLLQSRLWQLAHRFGNGSGGIEEPPREPMELLPQPPVSYRTHPQPAKVVPSEPPPFLSRYDRLTWDSRNTVNPVDQESYLPGNSNIPEYSSIPLQFTSPAFLDDSASETSEDPVVPVVSQNQESRPPFTKQDSFRKRAPLFKSHPIHSDQQRLKTQKEKISRSLRRFEPDTSINRDPFSFMRTFKKQRHRHKLRQNDMDYQTDSTMSDDHHRELDDVRSTEAGTTSEGASDAEDDYSDDFSPEQSRERLGTNRTGTSKDEVEYEDDFTSVAAPPSTSQRSASFSHSQTVVPSTGRSLRQQVNSSEEMLESELPRTSLEDPSDSRRIREEARDFVDELPRVRHAQSLPLPPSAPRVSDAPQLLSPGALERRLFAELHYLESVEESMRQIGDIERVRAVSMSQQETVSLAQILKSRQLAHNQELREAELAAQQNHLNALTSIEDTQQRFARAANIATQSIDQARLAMSTNAVPHDRTDAGQQVTLSHSTPMPVRSRSPTVVSSRHGSNSSYSSRKVTDESWRAADTDGDESSLVTDTPKNDDSGASIDEDILDHSFRMVLPSEEHRRRGRRSKEAQLQNRANGVGVDAAGEESNTPSFRRFTDDMVRQYMREEELRAQHQISLLKLRKNALDEKMHTELEFLETQKRQILKHQTQPPAQHGPYNQLVEKQTALVRRWKQEKAEIDKLLEAQELADRRRRIMLEQDVHISKLKNEAKKIREQDSDVHETGDRRNKRYDKKSLSEWEQKLLKRRQRAEELIRWQEKLKQEENNVKKLEKEAIKNWNKTSSRRPDKNAGSDSSTSGERPRQSPGSSPNSSSRTIRSNGSAKRRSSPSELHSDDSGAAPPRLKIGSDSTTSISEEVSTEEPSTTSQESVVRSARFIKRSDDESSIQEELTGVRADSRQASSADSIPEAVTAPSPTATQSIKTETIAGATAASITESVHGNSTSHAFARPRSRSPPSASYGGDTFESTSNTTSRLKRRLGDSVVTSLTSPRGPPRSTESRGVGLQSHQTNHRGGYSEDEDSFSCATTTMSERTEASDVEGRLHALKEDLKHRIRTLGKLKRQKERVNRERLKQKEELLHKHIEMYDKYITDLKAELDHDTRDVSMLDSSFVTPMKPQIKAPKATTRSRNSSMSDDRTGYQDSHEVEKSKKDDDEDAYSMNFTTTVPSETSKDDKSTKYYDDETSSSRSSRSELSRKLSFDDSRHEKSEVNQKSKSSISEAISEAISAKSSSLVRSSAMAANEGSDSVHSRSPPKSPVETTPREAVTEISEHLPSISTSTSVSSSRHEQVHSDLSSKVDEKEIPRQQDVHSPSEISEHLSEQPSYSAFSRTAEADETSTSRAPKKKLSKEESFEESLSEFLPSSVETKQDDATSGQKEVEVTTPRTPRRLTFSEINEEYSPSEPDTKSKDSGDSDGMMIIKPLPNLDLRPVSPESPRAKSPGPQPPSSPPHETPDDRIPLSARTIHSQMSDIPEDIPSEQLPSEKTDDRGPSEKSDDDYSYSEEFSAASSSRPASRSHVSETATRTSSSSASTVTPSESAPAAGSAAYSVSSAIEVEDEINEPESSEEEKSAAKEEVELKKRKAAPSEEKVAKIVEEIFRETLKDSLALSLAASVKLRHKQTSVAPASHTEIETIKDIEEKAPVSSVDEIQEDLKSQLSDNKEDVQTTREGSPTLLRSSSFELAAEDVIAEEVDRALAKRRMRRRLQSGGSDTEASPPISPRSSVSYEQDPPSFNVPESHSNVTSFKTPDLPDKSVSESKEPPTAEPEDKSNKTIPHEPVASSEKSSEPASRSPSPVPSVQMSVSRAEDDQSPYVVPHSRRHLREMVAQGVSDLWQYVCGPEAPRLDRLPTQPSFDFCLVGEGEDALSQTFPNIPEDVIIRSRRSYKHMVYGLILDIIRRIYAEEAPLRPWMCARPTRYRLWKDTKPPKTLNKLLSIVEEEVETHMAFSASKKRESKLTQWSRKKRAGLGTAAAGTIDPVDDLLKSELRTEEADWVNYETEEVQVKLQVAEGLLMDLIDDTVHAVKQIRCNRPAGTSPISAIPSFLYREMPSGWLDDSNPSLLI